MRAVTDLAKRVSSFFSEYLTHERNVSINTTRSYRDTFVLFVEFMREEKGVPVNKAALSLPTRESVLEFLKWLMEARHCGAATRNCRLAAVSSFVRYLQYVNVDRMEQWHRYMQAPLFPNKQGRKITRRGISYTLESYVTSARKENPDLIPERLSPHSLRHTRAMSLLHAGVNIINIRDILGHVSIRTTDIYARADSKAKREALEKAYENVAPKTDREWEKDRNILDWLKSL